MEILVLAAGIIVIIALCMWFLRPQGDGTRTIGSSPSYNEWLNGAIDTSHIPTHPVEVSQENDPKNWYIDEHGWISRVGFEESPPNITKPIEASKKIVSVTASASRWGSINLPHVLQELLVEDDDGARTIVDEFGHREKIPYGVDEESLPLLPGFMTDFPFSLHKGKGTRKVWLIYNDFDRAIIGVCDDEVTTKTLIAKLNTIHHSLYPSTDQFFSEERVVNEFTTAYSSDTQNLIIAQIWEEICHQ